MVIFDQLRISDDGRQMYIDAHISKAECFADTKIERLCICLGSQVYETLTIDPDSNGYIYSKNYPENTTEIHEAINIKDPDLLYNKCSFSKDLFFVYIKCTGIPEGCSCFTMTGNWVLAVTFDEALLYQKVMGYTKELAEDCSAPSKAFIDFILLWNAFKACVETEHYIDAIKFYKRMFGDMLRPVSATKKGCGCHG